MFKDHSDFYVQLTVGQNLDICFSLPGYEYTVVRVSPSSPLGSLSHDSRDMHFEGANGIVYVPSLALVIKAVPPRGESDLRHEAHVYNVLASLQGRVLPRLACLRERDGGCSLRMTVATRSRM